MIVKEQNVKDFLFKEAEEKKEHRDRIVVHEVLFSEVEDCEKVLEEDENLEKQAHALQSGGSNLKNSGWNTEWNFEDPTPSIENAKGEVSQKSRNFFASLQQGLVGDLRPKALAFSFHYYRTIIPNNDPESQGKAQNAMDAIGSIPGFEGFQEFQQDIQNSNIPLNSYSMVSKFSPSDGDVHEDKIQEFVSRDQAPLALPNGDRVPTAYHYKDHKARIDQGGRVNKTSYMDQAQTFPMSEINSATSAMLVSAINDRMGDGKKRKGDGYQPQVGKAIASMFTQRLNDNNLDLNTDNADVTAYRIHYSRLFKNIREWLKDRESVKLTSFGLRVILQSMVHSGGTPPKTPPDQFKAKVKNLYSANGWDSSYKDPATKMLTLPPLRQLPLGEVVYDRGQGNMGYNHLIFNWKTGLGQLFQKWGGQCDQWLKALQKGQGIRQIAQQSPEVAEAWKNVMFNRTGAENLVELFQKYPTWEKFNDNHLQKSLASEIRTVNKLSKNKATSQALLGGDFWGKVAAQAQEISAMLQVDPQTKKADPASAKAAHDQLTQISTELVQYYMKEKLTWDQLTYGLHQLNYPVAKMGAYAPVADSETGLPTENTPTSSTRSIRDLALNELKNGNPSHGVAMGFLSSMINVDPNFANGPGPMMIMSIQDNPQQLAEFLRGFGFDEHKTNDPEINSTEAVSAPSTKNKRVTNGITAHSDSRQATMIDQQGFEMLQQYGYQVGKIMDFLSAMMYRSCHEQVNTPFGVEDRFGHKYSTSSGTSEGGDIILGVNYDKLEAQPNETQVDVYEKLSFSLKQQSGANDEPIVLRMSLPWEQMFDTFNEMYPEAGFQFQVVSDPVTESLDKLEDKIKEAITETKGDVKVIYHNSQGREIPLSGQEVMLDKMEEKEQDEELDLTDTSETQTQPEAQPGVDPVPSLADPVPSPYEIVDNVIPPSTQPYVSGFPGEPDEREMPRPKSKPMTDPMVSPLHDPASRYIQKKDTKGRRLLRQNAGLGSIEERLQKAANKLDECSEFSVADKIDLLLKKMNEGKDVREASRV